MEGALGVCDCMYQLDNSQPWECDRVTLPLSFQAELADGSRLYRKVRRKLKLHSWVNILSQN